MQRHPNVANLNEVEPRDGAHGSRFAYRTRWLSKATGAQQIGCSWFEVPPGKTAFPRHFHCANEESMYVLEGTGTLRLGDQEIFVGPGDYVAFPVGPGAAHQVVNSGTGPLRYLALSTKIAVELVGYPDSKKIGARAFIGDGPPPVMGIFKEDATVGYYDGEASD